MGIKQTKPLLKEKPNRRPSTENCDTSCSDWIQGDTFLLCGSSDENIFGVGENRFSVNRKYQRPSHTKSGNLKFSNSQEVRNVSEMIRKGEKIIVVMRGLPGSGKSTLAHHLIKSLMVANKEKLIFSADDSFVDPATNEYHFNRHLLHKAHLQNVQNVLNAAKRNVTPIIIDNTNLAMSEILPYASIAVKYQYTLKFLEPCTPWRYNGRECAKRNLHGVQEQRIFTMMKRFDRSLTETDLFSLPSKTSFVNYRQKKKRREHKMKLVSHSGEMDLLPYDPAKRLPLPRIFVHAELSTLMGECFVVLQKCIANHTEVAHFPVLNKEGEEETVSKNIFLLQQCSKLILKQKNAWTKTDGVITHRWRNDEFLNLVHVICSILRDDIENCTPVRHLLLFSEQALSQNPFMRLLAFLGSRTPDADLKAKNNSKFKHKLKSRNNHEINNDQINNIQYSLCNISPSVFSHAMTSLPHSIMAHNEVEKGYEEEDVSIRGVWYTGAYSSETPNENSATADENCLRNVTKGDNDKHGTWDLSNGVSWGVKETSTQEMELCRTYYIPPKPPRPYRKLRVTQNSREECGPQLLAPKPPRPNRKPRVPQFSWEEYAPKLEAKSGELAQELEKWDTVEDPVSSWRSKQTRECRTDTGRGRLAEKQVLPLLAGTDNMDTVVKRSGSSECDGSEMQEAISKPQRARRNRNH